MGPNVTFHVFASAGAGLLVGVLVGLSVSPVAGLVLSAFAAVGFAWLTASGERSSPALEKSIATLSEALAALAKAPPAAAQAPDAKPDARQGNATDLQAIRLGAFSIVCVLALFLGVYLRAHNVLGTEAKERGAVLKEHVAAWQTIGFSPEQARRIVVMATLSAPRPNGQAGDRTGTFIFGDGSTRNIPNLNPKELKDSDEVLTAYERKGGAYAAFAAAVRKIPDPRAKDELLEAAWSILKELQ